MWRAVWFVLLAVAVALQVPVGVYGAEWPLAGASRVVRSYGETYVRADGSSVRHSGTDLAAEPGSRVYAVTDGVIVFVGSVPSANGGTHVAITVESPNGDKWSYLPAEASVVSVGDSVQSGEHLGFLASGGDASALESHLHIGLRSAGEYCDPIGLLSIPDAPGQGMPVAGGTSDGETPMQDVSPPVPSIPQGLPVNLSILDSSVGHSQVGLASPTPGDLVASTAAVVVPVLSEPTAALIRDADVIRPGAPIHQYSAGHLTSSVPIPVSEATRLAPALVAVAVLFVGYLKRPRSCCVTAPGDTVAAVVGQ